MNGATWKQLSALRQDCLLTLPHPQTPSLGEGAGGRSRLAGLQALSAYRPPKTLPIRLSPSTKTGSTVLGPLILGTSSTKTTSRVLGHPGLGFRVRVRFFGLTVQQVGR